VKRRTFIAALGGAAAWPLVARGQSTAMPLVVYLQVGQTHGTLTDIRDKAILTGLREAGFENGRNVIVDPVPVPTENSMRAVVAAQTKRKVAVIYGNLMAASAAKAATNTIPIVFGTVDDPLVAGLISGYSHPGGNVTGVRMRAGDEPAKLIELLHELSPAAGTVGVVMHPGGLTSAEDKASIEAAAQSKGLHTVIALVSDENQFEPTFAGFARANVDAVLIRTYLKIA
jgi:putative ABC transport system substrate-binding protein